MMWEERRKKYHGRIPLPGKSEMVHKSKVVYSRKGKQNWKYQSKEESSMSDQAKWMAGCKAVLEYVDANEEIYKFSDEQTDEVRFFVSEGTIRNQGKLLRQLDEISIIVRVQMKDSRMSDRIQDHIEMMIRPAGLQ